jgi:hypothetical protein
VQRFTPLIVEAARPCRHSVGDRWFVDETYVKVAGTWRYVCRAVDQHGQVIDVYVSKKRDVRAATRFFSTAIKTHGEPAEVTTDRSPALARTIVELLPGVHHDTTQYANNRVAADHGRLTACRCAAPGRTATSTPSLARTTPARHPSPAHRAPATSPSPASFDHHASRMPSTNGPSAASGRAPDAEPSTTTAEAEATPTTKHFGPSATA